MSDPQKTLNIVIITQGISRIVKPLCSSHHNIAGIVESQMRGEKSSLIRNLYRVIKGGRPLQKYARKSGIPYYFLENKAKQSPLAHWIKQKNADLIVVHSMSQLLKQEVYAAPPLGSINLHPSYLPEYRGANPDFWQYHDMEMEPGVTVHYVSEGEDMGDIIAQERTTIPLGIKSPERLDLLIGKIGVKLLLQSIDDLAQDNIKPIKQPKGSPTARARNLKLAEHKSIINWQEWNGEHIWHILRGTESWLNALDQPTGLLKGQRWIIEEFEKQTSQKRPPATIYKDNGKQYVACKDGRIKISIRFSLKRMILNLLK